MIHQTLALLFSFAFSIGAAFSAPPPMPKSFIAEGTKNIAQAWLATPTTRYPHFVLGDRYEASSLVAELQNGEQLIFDLPDHLVFEDRHVRLADLDQDGNDELIVVMSSVEQGATLAAFAVVEGKLKLIAQTPFIGTPNRWLNPAGIADYDGDGQLEIALVQKPHLTKRLEFWRMIDGGFQRVAHFDGASNHRLGSRHQLLSTSFDVDGNGVLDLLIPDAGRTNLLAISLSTPNNLIKTWSMPAPIDGTLTLTTENGRTVLTIPLQDGQKLLLPLP